MFESDKNESKKMPRNDCTSSFEQENHKRASNWGESDSFGMWISQHSSIDNLKWIQKSKHWQEPSSSSLSLGMGILSGKQVRIQEENLHHNFLSQKLIVCLKCFKKVIGGGIYTTTFVVLSTEIGGGINTPTFVVLSTK